MIRALGQIHYQSKEFLEVSSAFGGSKLKWVFFKELVISDTQTILVTSFWSFLPLPTDQLPAGAVDFLKERFAANNKKVADRRKQL